MVIRSTKEYGLELENYIANKFKEVGYKNARPSKMSGAGMEKGDISGIDDLFCVEAKNRNTKDITLKMDVWRKLCSEISLHSNRLPLYVLRQEDNKTFAVMDIDDFFIILKGYLESKE